MCVNYGFKELPKSTKGVGWKAFYPQGMGYVFMNFPLHGKWKVPQNEWLTAHQRKVTTVKYVKLKGEIRPKERVYLSGFHIWVKKPSANYYGHLVKVHYEGGRIRGTQSGRGVIIADYMWVGDNPTPRKEAKGVNKNNARAGKSSPKGSAGVAKAAVTRKPRVPKR